MRTWPRPGLLLLATLLIQVSLAEDLYWEGDEDASKEFLVVKDDASSLKRHKRDFWSPFSFFSTASTTTAAPENYESITEDQDDTISIASNNKDDEDLSEGSGSPGVDKIDIEVAEKTLRVTFVVVQPYRVEYSNRDSPQFQQFSKTLADSVNVLFDNLPGTQKASLVRIQSRLADEFSCKVTLDIVTNGFDDTNRITTELRDHIRNYRYLGDVAVKDDDFSANVVNPGSAFETCQFDELECDDGSCIAGSARCNGTSECRYGSDEQGCPIDYEKINEEQTNQWQSAFPTTKQPERPTCDNPTPCISSSVTYCPEELCDGIPVCPLGDDESMVNCIDKKGPERGDQPLYTTPADLPEPTTTDSPDIYASSACQVGEFRCDDNRCILNSKVCDQENDCNDGTDERDCESKACGTDDFRCNNGMCIESRNVCNKIIDCPDGEDEQNCDCRKDEFRCDINGACIEIRKWCDNYTDCVDGSDEKNCGQHVCRDRGKFRCGDGSCISLLLRCDGFRDCRLDGADELECPCRSDQWQCDQGQCIERSKRCNGKVDCPADRSDERQCIACGVDDFRCNNGYCIPKSKRCDGMRNCQDGSDEQSCNNREAIDKKLSMAYEFQCTSGQNVPADSYCNGTAECNDNSDEKNCTCKRGEFRCRNGKCINIAQRCDGYRDCEKGDDEWNCVADCPPEMWSCNSNSSVACATRCNNIPECDTAEDEQDCQNDCPPEMWTCNSDSSVACATRCNNIPECDTAEDEQDCENECQHHCDGRCLEDALICNGEADCRDGSDETSCDNCEGPDDFRCANGECIKLSQRCNQAYECSDMSDEQNCNKTIIATNEGCLDGQFQCRSGQCISMEFFCDGNNDCYYDNSDEEHCQCQSDEFRCASRECIPSSLRCDRRADCPDGSDEQDCYDSLYPSTSVPTDTYTPRKEQEDPDYWPYRSTTAKPRDYPTSATDSPYGSSAYPSNQGGGTSSGQGGQPNYPGQGTDSRYDGRYPNNQGGGTSSGQGGQPNYSGQGTDSPYDSRYPNNQGGGTSSGQSGQPNYPGQGTDSPYDSRYPNNQGGGTSTGQSGQPNYPGQGTDSRYDSRYPNNQGGGTSSGQGGQPNYSGQDTDSRYDSRYPNNQGGGTSSGQGGQPNYSGQDTDSRYDSRYPNNQGGGTSSGQGGQPNYSGQDTDSRYDSRYPNNQGGSTSSGQSGQPNYPGQGTDSPYDSSYPNNQGGGASSGQGGQPGYGYPGQGNGSTVKCQYNEWACEMGPCIDERKRCDGHVDCPRDISDEFNCPAGSPAALNIKTYPNEQTQRFGGDVVFVCRDEGPIRAPVRWVREGGRSLKPGSIDRNGRLELFNVTTGDSGTYICQSPRYLGQPGSQVSVSLAVSKPAPSRPDYFAKNFRPCKPHEATCFNGDCIPKSSVCDGKFDCSDRSDEERCTFSGVCEPNQFQCGNRKCVLKTWLCDSDDDCGDNSDEQNCQPAIPGQPCLPTEFSCRSSDQCVPKSFHCDGRSDCFDGSDEIGCAPVHITKPPQPANLKLNPGDTLVLRAEAAGVPTPVISWRLNWGHVPPQCTSTSENGIGILTCPNMRPEHSGAYSAEGINNRATTFATPDAIVFVSQTSPCPQGYFNNEARSERECIRCFCFGESTQCQSADLFTYVLPTPLGQGGTRLLGVTVTPVGEVRTDSSINNHYYYEPLRNGAAVTKLESYDERSLGSFHPYLTLPETYNGNQLTSYGGHIKFTMAPHRRAYYIDESAPAVIVKGKYATLFNFQRPSNPSNDISVDIRFTPDNWMKPGLNGFEVATREDIMMALDLVDTILIRADLNNAGANISNFVMESAHHTNVGLGAASLVEECKCPPGYEGLSCQKCSPGYVREKSGPWLGNCVREACPAGTYGDPSRGLPCRPCPCPLTNRENQFARTCSLGFDGSVSCDCFPGYEGKNCEVCAPGYEGNPLVAGDTCRVRPAERCDPTGTRDSTVLGECECKENVQGRYCDQCKNDSFYLSNDFRHGCALCFCSGVSQQCMSSNLRRKTTTVNFNVPAVVQQVAVYESSPAGSGRRYTSPVATDLKPVVTRSGLTVTSQNPSQPKVYYWSLPYSFAGNKVTSYGGYLRYTLENVPSYIDRRARNDAADVQLISDNHLVFQYSGDFQPTPEGVLNATVQFLERGWHRSDGKEVSREHFLLALADVKTILIKATYATDVIATPITASIDTAQPGGDGPSAPHVEQCVCPTGYIGTSCEDCASGYTRSSQGLYLEHCGLCECNGHSRKCHPETGECYDCMDNTEGPNCEFCKPGYERDDYDNCVAAYTSTATPCNCDPRGSEGPCDYSGRCTCKANVEGQNCDRCRAGTFGLDAANPDGCIACFCSGVTQDCQEANHYARIPLAAPILGDRYGGYSITDLNSDTVINDGFVPVPDFSELVYVFDYPPVEDLYWSLPVFPGNRILSYGGTLALKQEFKSNKYNTVSTPGTDVVLMGDGISIFWTNPNQLRSEQSLSYQVPLREQNWRRLGTVIPASRNDFMRVLKNLRRVLVRATVAEDMFSTSISDVSMDTATDSAHPDSPAATGVEICSCPPGHMGTSCESCIAGYYKDAQDYCTLCPCAGHDCQLNAYGQVTCNCRPPYTGPDCSTIVGDSLTTTVRPGPPPKSTVTVRITSPTITIREIGSSVNFTCQAQSIMTNQRLRVNWNKIDGVLPLDRVYIDEYSGLLKITNLQLSDSGVYICQTKDGVSTGQDTVTLRVPPNDMQVPTVSIRPAVNDYYEGDRIELECVAEGNPTPTITWQRASRLPLPASANPEDALLVISSAIQEDSGEYSCIASNTVGTGMRTAAINIRPRPSRPTRDRLTVSSTSSVLNEGQSTTVVCTGPVSVPAGTIDWVRQDNARFQANVRSDNGVLYIDGATIADQGVYICQTQDSTVAPAYVVVTVISTATPSPADAADISVTVKSLKIPTGETGTVDCLPQGYPQPQIRWTKHGGEFGPGVSQRGNKLIINNAQETDRGYYVCEGLVDGQLIKNIYVYVEIEKREAPKVEIWPEGEQPVAIGNTFEFQCRVLAGIPEPVVTWSRRGDKPLTPTTEIKLNNILRLEKVDVNDEGQYICTASNIAGTASASAVIKVRSPPEIHLSGGNYIEVQAGEPLVIDCRARGYPEPMVSIRGPDRREFAPPTPSIATIRINSASERDDGSYTCIATSPAGTYEEPFLVQVDRGDGGNADFGGSGENSINTDPDQNSNNYDPDYDSDRDPGRPSDLIVADGQPRTEIDCSVTEGFGVRWDRSGQQPLQTNARQEGNKLVIYNVSSSDSGQYVCSMYNYGTGDVQTARHISLLVVRRPRIMLRPETQVVRPGQSPTVECIVEGEDVIDIHWEPFNPSPSTRVEIRNATLIFHQIEVEDAGRYQCFARNRYVNSSAIAEVIVAEEKEGLDSHANEQWIRVGDAVALSCNVSSDARVKWTKDGRQVPRSVLVKDDGSLYIKPTRKSHSGRYVCHIRDSRGRVSSNYINLHIEGPTENAGQLVRIDQPRRRFIPGENVEVLCKSTSPGVEITWEKYGTRQYVEVRRHGYGVLLIIHGVSEADAGLYRCIGTDPYGESSVDDFNLEVEPATGVANPTYPRDRPEARYTARLGDSVNMPCTHNLDEPANIKWRREYASLPPDTRSDQPILHLTNVNEGDAGTYVCRVSNNRAVVETRAILQVTGVVPMFNGEGWVALPTIKDPYRQFDIEVSFKPADNDGLILYNSQNKGRTGDYVALQLNEGVPEFIMETGNGPVVVKGDRPLRLNAWHTIRLSRIGSRVSMDVDNTGPFTNETTENWVLDLQEPLYVGGSPYLDQLPEQLAGASGFNGCVSMLIVGRVEINILMDSLDRYNVEKCDSCTPNLCLNGGVCQEARNERGYVCICSTGYAGQNCSRRGEACQPGLCGIGKCEDTDDGYKCTCPVTHTGRNCQDRQSIEYPAFTGSAYLAILPPDTYRFLKLELKVKAASPVQDGIIMYCAESARGLGGFTSLAVRNQKLEFRYVLSEGNPVVLISDSVLRPNVWTDVQATRSGAAVSLVIDKLRTYEQQLDSATESLKLKTPMFLGGVDDTITLNNYIGVTGGFSGCIRDPKIQGKAVDIVNTSIQSANVQECSNSDIADRGDIPEGDLSCACMNGGVCNADGSCSCPPSFSGKYCESRTASSLQNRRVDPCAFHPCRNGGTCRTDYSNMMNHSCDCPLGFAGASCQMELELLQDVGFNGNGYIELPASLVEYNKADEPTIIALAVHTTKNGVLFYQRETSAHPDAGDFILLRIENGYVVLDWDMGGGVSSLTIDSKFGFVADGERHQIIVKLLSDNTVELNVDGVSVSGYTSGFSQIMNADSNLYIGGIPDSLNIQRYMGLIGCVEQVEFMSLARSVNLGQVAVAGRNTQRCRESMFPDLYPYFDEVDVFESPPPEYFYNSSQSTKRIDSFLPILVMILSTVLVLFH